MRFSGAVIGLEGPSVGNFHTLAHTTANKAGVGWGGKRFRTSFSSIALPAPETVLPTVTAIYAHQPFLPFLLFAQRARSA